jgi:uncharacterized membrane protein
MEQGELKIIVIIIVVLIVIYMIMRRRTENIKHKRNDRSRFGRDS